MAEDLPASSMSLKTANKLMRQLNNTPQLLIFWFIEWALKLTSSLAQEIQKVNGAGSVRDYIQKKKGLHFQTYQQKDLLGQRGRAHSTKQYT